MIGKILQTLGIGDGSLNQEGEPRRRHIRHPGLQAEVEVADRAYSVRDWSLGGVFFETVPDARLAAGDEINMTVRFRFPHETISISHLGRIVRSAKRGIAAEFLPLNGMTRREFQRVLDTFNAQGFVESQVA
jgi:hypothetical protein